MSNTKKSPARKNSSKITHKSQADRKRSDLIKQLRADLKASKESLKSASTAAREELKLVNASAKAEIAVLKDQLSAVVKREQALLKVSEQKVIMMWKAGEQWEKKQVAKIRKAFR